MTQGLEVLAAVALFLVGLVVLGLGAYAWTRATWAAQGFGFRRAIPTADEYDDTPQAPQRRARADWKAPDAAAILEVIKAQRARAAAGGNGHGTGTEEEYSTGANAGFEEQTNPFDGGMFAEPR